MYWVARSSKLPPWLNPKKGTHLFTYFRWYLELWQERAFQVLKLLLQIWHSYPPSDGKCLLSRCLLASVTSLLTFPQSEQEYLLPFLAMYCVARSSKLPRPMNINQITKDSYKIKNNFYILYIYIITLSLVACMATYIYIDCP